LCLYFEKREIARGNPAALIEINNRKIVSFEIREIARGNPAALIEISCRKIDNFEIREIARGNPAALLRWAHFLCGKRKTIWQTGNLTEKIPFSF
jgi:hypothetical protein